MVYIEISIKIADSRYSHETKTSVERTAEMTLPDLQCVDLSAVTHALVDDAVATYSSGGDSKDKEA